MSKTVSVIIPIYKVEKYLRKCIKSIVGQTYPNLEIILVDDGSPDKSGIICDEMSALDERIKVIHKQNSGVSDARNIGIEISKGDYIYFIDGDDYAEPDAVEVLVQYAEKENADIVVANTNIVTVDGILIETVECTDKKEYQVLTSKEAVDYFMTLDWGPWNKLYRKDIHEEIFFPSSKIHEDEAIMLHLLAKCHKVVCLRKNLYNYVKRIDSTTTSSYNVRKIDWFDAWVKNVEFTREYFPQSLDKAISKMIVTAIYNLDNLLELNNDLYMKVLEGIDRYYREIIFNNKISIQYKVRVIIARISIKLYKKIYIRG